MSNNKIVRIINGNRREQNTALCLHWNSGSAYLENKMDHIRDIIGRYKPVILGISEANLRSGIDILEARVNGYEILHLNALNNLEIKMSRVVVYVRSDVRFNRRSDLENNTDASLWIDLLMKGGRKLTIGNIYREFQIAGHLESRSNEQQLNRWKSITDSWVNAGNSDTIVMGDFNLDFMKWDNLSGINDDLANLVNMKVQTLGFTNIILEPTHIHPWGSSAIDHCWNNIPRRIVGSININYGISDHNIIGCRVRNKHMDLRDDIIVKRSMIKYDKVKYLELLDKCDWNFDGIDNNVDLMVDKLSTNIQGVLDELCPMNTYTNNMK